MQIETKFNVGDTVYVCKNNSTKDLETCKICDGKGAIIIKDESFCCPKCHGGKFTYSKRVKKFVPEKRIIKKMIVSVTENNGNTQIYENMIVRHIQEKIGALHYIEILCLHL